MKEKLIFSILMTLLATARATDAGVVVAGEGDCAKSDRVVIETRRGYTLAEQYRGRFDRGYQVYGELHRYGFKNVVVRGRDGRIYIDDYSASRSKAEEWCSQR